MKKKLLCLLLSCGLIGSLCACSGSASPSPENREATLITLSDEGVTVDGETASTDETAAVYTGAEIIYYKDGTDESYGEGEESEKHSTEEAAAHTVVTITQPGAYRLTGTLSLGQIAIDLGKEAKRDPEAVVTLILDNVDVTCTVAPALIFYNVYECDEAWVAYDEEEVEDFTPSGTVDTSAAGANVILAAGSENTFTGSHVARIYKEGTTKKLHKYDGAFYSKMSMNISGDGVDDSGILHIIADNEGLDSELHLTINGGTITIDSQDDGINTNEDDVSVTTINGGSLTINAGQGAEGDGIDSNGYLTINGGTIWTMANERTPDGGIDADSAITINGGTLSAFGTRNDAVDAASTQPYMELSFASTLPEGSVILVKGPDEMDVWTATTQKACQSITLSVPSLDLDTAYSVYVDGVLQCYSGNRSGMMGGPGGGMEPPEDFDPGKKPDDMPEPPEGFEPGDRPDDEGRPGDRKGPEDQDLHDLIEGMPEEMIPDGYTREALLAMSDDELQALYQDMAPHGAAAFPGRGDETADGSGSTEFILTGQTRSFSGVCDSDASGKTRVTFTVEGTQRSGRDTTLPAVTSITSSVELDPSQVQITVTDVPSEDYSESCTWADGLDAINALLPESPGDYLFTIAVISGSEGYTGATQIAFTISSDR